MFQHCITLLFSFFALSSLDTDVMHVGKRDDLPWRRHEVVGFDLLIAQLGIVAKVDVKTAGAHNWGGR